MNTDYWVYGEDFMNDEINNIKERLKKFESGPVEIDNKFSVLIPFIEVNGETHILYEKRASNLRSQPGEVSFPGGRIENGENSYEATVRETCEELLIKRNDFEIFSKGDFLVNPAIAIIYSYIGFIKKDFKDIVPSKDEVDRCFTVPLKYFIENEPKSYNLEMEVKRDGDFPFHLIPNGKNYKFKRSKADKTYFYKYKDEIIWGFTAKLTYELIKKLK